MQSKVYCVSVILLMAICLKVLLIPSYTSTDFEVHRNWLAITHSLPIRQWYFEATSEWTLDYPPFFAWFEKGLSKVAVHVDDEMVNISSINYKSDRTLFFQRGSVIATDLLLAYAGYKCTNLESIPIFDNNRQILFCALLILNCGLLIVDHIHFQYNGFLFGILFLSISNVMQRSFYMAAFWFAVLLNFKHIFLYVAPAFGVYFLRVYCMNPFTDIYQSFRVTRIVLLAAIVITVFALSFGPFILSLDQLFKRLFPFKRGLTHAFWAPNFWALYNAFDRILALVGKRLGLLKRSNMASSTSGLVQSIDHMVLPSIPPILTFLLTFFSMIPCLLNMFIKPKLTFIEQFNQFLRAIVLCSLCSFMFGWHVHEKAILMAILPSTLLALTGTEEDARNFLFLQTVGHYSLFPLLFEPFEAVTKLCLLLFYSIVAFSTIGRLYEPASQYLPCLSFFETIFLLGLFVIEIFSTIVFPLSSSCQHYAFLPLLLISVYSALGISWSFASFYVHSLTC